MVNRKLKALRAENGDTQEKLADFLEIRINTYNWKENGKAKFTLDEAQMISQRYGKTIEEIFFATRDDNVTIGSN